MELLHLKVGLLQMIECRAPPCPLSLYSHCIPIARNARIITRMNIQHYLQPFSTIHDMYSFGWGGEGKPFKVDGDKPSHPGGKALGLCHLRLDFDGKTKLFQETLGSGAWCDAMEAAVLQMREHEVAEASMKLRGWVRSVLPQATRKRNNWLVDTCWKCYKGNDDTTLRPNM